MSCMVSPSCSMSSLDDGPQMISGRQDQTSIKRENRNMLQQPIRIQMHARMQLQQNQQLGASHSRTSSSTIPSLQMGAPLTSASLSSYSYANSIIATTQDEADMHSEDEERDASILARTGSNVSQHPILMRSLAWSMDEQEELARLFSVSGEQRCPIDLTAIDEHPQLASWCANPVAVRDSSEDIEAEESPSPSPQACEPEANEQEAHEHGHAHAHAQEQEQEQEQGLVQEQAKEQGQSTQQGQGQVGAPEAALQLQPQLPSICTSSAAVSDDAKEMTSEFTRSTGGALSKMLEDTIRAVHTLVMEDEDAEEDHSTYKATGAATEAMYAEDQVHPSDVSKILLNKQNSQAEVQTELQAELKVE